MDEMLKKLRALIAAKLDERTKVADKITAIRTLCDKEAREPNDTESADFETAVEARQTLDAEVADLRQQATDLEAEIRGNAAAADMLAGIKPEERSYTPATISHEPHVYARGGQTSYFRDLVAAQVSNSRSAVERLQRNSREVEVDMKTRALTTVDGAGGDFVPPVWMMEQYVAAARAGRVVADQLNKKSLPGGTDSLNLPRIATGTAVAQQATQNTAVQNTDATTDSVTGAVITIAGQQVVAVQLIEQSPINMDEILLADLAADYAVKADQFVISNNATNKWGLLSVAGLNAVTYTDATPTVGELYSKNADAIQQVGSNRFLPAQKHFMHPRRWAWYTAALDTQNRPLVVPASNIPTNVLAAMGDVVAEGFVGMLQGLPVYVDPNIPTNLGAGVNEDRIITARTDDVLFFEGSPKAEAFRETKADQLSVLLRFYNYAAIISNRYPKSISVISGTGLIAPVF